MILLETDYCIIIDRYSFLTDKHLPDNTKDSISNKYYNAWALSRSVNELILDTLTPIQMHIETKSSRSTWLFKSLKRKINLPMQTKKLNDEELINYIILHSDFILKNE